MQKILLSALLLTTAVHATPINNTTIKKYAVIIDAGSTSSKLHLYQYSMHAFETPVITEIFSESIKPNLASYASHPQDAGASYKPLLDDVLAQIKTNQIDPQTVSISVLGTAGMRLLSQANQAAIYKNVTAYFQQNYPFSISSISTISGQSEGLYDWLDVNYLAQTFQNKTPPLGTIDMGGASTEIAFQTNDFRYYKDENMLTINTVTYNVYSKSFLGLGEDQALAKVDSGQTPESCYPLGYAFNTNAEGKFDYYQCQDDYQSLIEAHNVSKELAPTFWPKFVAFSGVFYTYNFFNVATQPTYNALKTNILNVCNLSWDQLKAQYPNESDAYLSTYCADGSYLTELLYKTYKLRDSQLTVTNQVNGQNIDWALGALLFNVVTNPN